MWLIEVFILGALMMIFVQDIKKRSVNWMLFPILTGLLITLRLLGRTPLAVIWYAVLINTTFLVIQFLVVSIYFSIKNKRLANITKGLLGWGDILFLLSIAFYLSVLNFLLFYIISLIAVLLAWFVWRLVSKGEDNHIPLAGFQALLFAIFLTSSWLFKCFDVTNDGWLLYLINK